MEKNLKNAHRYTHTHTYLNLFTVYLELTQYCKRLYFKKVSLIAQLVRNMPSMQETWVQFLGWEDPLEKEMSTHSSILAWKIPWTQKPGGLQSMGL